MGVAGCHQEAFNSMQLAVIGANTCASKRQRGHPVASPAGCAGWRFVNGLGVHSTGGRCSGDPFGHVAAGPPAAGGGKCKCRPAFAQCHI